MRIKWDFVIFWLITWAFTIVFWGFWVMVCVRGCQAQELTASWYSVQSLKDEGTYKTSKGIMANGEKFKDEALTCATRDYPLGTVLCVRDNETGRVVEVKVTDRISKRFQGKRIDLSKGSMVALGGERALKKGLLRVEVNEARPLH